MAKNYRDIFRTESAKLKALAASSFDHPTAKGDSREELVREFLRPRIGTAFGIEKAEIVDSDGRTTGEYDAVVFDARTGGALASEGGRRVVRVESAVLTIEIKSQLRHDDLKELFTHQNKELLQLHRRYRPTQELLNLQHLQRAALPFKNSEVANDDAKRHARTEAMFKDGLLAMMHHESIPEVSSFVFGFEGCAVDGTQPYLQFPGVDVVSILGEYTVAKENVGFPANPPGLLLWAEGDDALGAFVFLIERCLDLYLEGRRWVSPAWERYFLQSRTLPKLPKSNPAP